MRRPFPRLGRYTAEKTHSRCKGGTAMTEYTQTQLRQLETIGCDLGDKTCELFVIRPDETTLRPKAIPTTREGFRKFFEMRPKAHVVLEVGAHSLGKVLGKVPGTLPGTLSGHHPGAITEIEELKRKLREMLRGYLDGG
jgi:hypothetical protein